MARTLADGDAVEVKGSTSTYTLERKGDLYSCTCPAWRNQSRAIDARTCKHLRAYLGDAAETARVGAAGVLRAGGAKPPGGKATAPPVLLAQTWALDQDPTGWWMSEKLDGIRAYWDGASMISRLGNRFDAPPWFVAGLPDTPLDGELWLGRKKFQQTTSIVRRVGGGAAWKALRYVVFDAPAAGGPFEARIERCRAMLAEARPEFALWHEQVGCEGVEHLKAELARVEALGGEGLMLRRPGSTYEVGRSSSLLKVKTFHDAEARVIGHQPGAGKHTGRLGALLVALADGTRFAVGTGFSDSEREDPPAIGDVVTFRYQELSDDGVPRFPSYVGRRVDVDVVKLMARREPGKGKGKAQTQTGTGTGTGTEIVASLEHPAGKFWEIEVRGAQHVTRFGKVGTPGQARVVAFDDEEAARADAAKRAATKQREGYVARRS